MDLESVHTVGANSSVSLPLHFSQVQPVSYAALCKKCNSSYNWYRRKLTVATRCLFKVATIHVYGFSSVDYCVITKLNCPCHIAEAHIQECVCIMGYLTNITANPLNSLKQHTVIMHSHYF